MKITWQGIVIAVGGAVSALGSWYIFAWLDAYNEASGLTANTVEQVNAVVGFFAFTQQLGFWR